MPNLFSPGTHNSGLPRNEVFALAVDAQGSIWSGCWNGVGLTKFDGEAWTVYDTENNGFAGRLSSSPLARQTHRAGPFARVRAISSNQCSSAVGFRVCERSEASICSVSDLVDVSTSAN